MRLGLGLGVKNSTFVGGYDPDAAAFLAATGITSKTESDAINDLVVRLKGYGLWSKMKAIYPFVSDTINLLSYTEDLSNGVYTNANLTVATNSTTAPDGTNTADKLTATTFNGAHDIKQTTTDSTSQCTYSVYLKANGLNYVNLNINDNVANGAGALFDLSNGTIVGDILVGSGWSVVSKSITSAGNGWYRCVITINATGSTRKCEIGPRDTNSTAWSYTFVGNNVNGIYAWGLQFQSGSSVTTYQPIATTPANRFVSQFKYNLKDARDLDAAYRLAFNGTWAYSKQGATGNGVNNFINTYYNPNTYGQLNSAHLSVYNRTSLGLGGTLVLMGAKIGANIQSLTPKAGSESWDSMNGTDSNITGFVYSSVDNLVLVNRTNSADFQSWFAGVKLKTTTQASVAKPDGNVYISGRNQGYAAYPEANQKAFATIGDGLTDQEASNLYTSIQIYQQDLSRAVGTPITKVSDLSAQSYVAATQIQNTVYATAVDVFVKGMKAVGLWEKMKAVYPFVSDNVNQFGYTEDFTYNPMWVQTRCAMASNVTTAPDGTMTADSFTTTSTTIECMLRTSITSPYNNVTQTTSVYAKKSTANYFRIRNLSSGGDAWFNLTNGTIGSVLGGQTATMTNVGNGWYRCTLTGTKGVSATDLYDIGFTDANETRYPSASVVGFLWGAQLQLGSTATTYIPVASTVDNKFVQQFKYNLMSPLDANGSFRLAFSGTWAYSLQGAKANGTNAYASTFFDGSLNQSTNSNAIGFYANIANTSALSDPSSMGNVRVSDLNGSAMTASGTSLSTRLNNIPVLGTISGATGFFTATKQSATVTKVFKNAAEIASGNSGGIPINDTMLIANINIAGAPYAAGYVSNQFTFAYMSDGLSNAEISNYYTLVQGLQINLNRQV